MKVKLVGKVLLGIIVFFFLSIYGSIRYVNYKTKDTLQVQLSNAFGSPVVIDNVSLGLSYKGAYLHLSEVVIGEKIKIESFKLGIKLLKSYRAKKPLVQYLVLKAPVISIIQNDSGLIVEGLGNEKSSDEVTTNKEDQLANDPEKIGLLNKLWSFTEEQKIDVQFIDGTILFQTKDGQKYQSSEATVELTIYPNRIDGAGILYLFEKQTKLAFDVNFVKEDEGHSVLILNSEFNNLVIPSFDLYKTPVAFDQVKLSLKYNDSNDEARIFLDKLDIARGTDQYLRMKGDYFLEGKEKGSAYLSIEEMKWTFEDLLKLLPDKIKENPEIQKHLKKLVKGQIDELNASFEGSDLADPFSQKNKINAKLKVQNIEVVALESYPPLSEVSFIAELKGPNLKIMDLVAVLDTIKINKGTVEVNEILSPQIKASLEATTTGQDISKLVEKLPIDKSIFDQIQKAQLSGNLKMNVDALVPRAQKGKTFLPEYKAKLTFDQFSFQDPSGMYRFKEMSGPLTYDHKKNIGVELKGLFDDKYPIEIKNQGMTFVFKSLPINGYFTYADEILVNFARFYVPTMGIVGKDIYLRAVITNDYIQVRELTAKTEELAIEEFYGTFQKNKGRSDIKAKLFFMDLGSFITKVMKKSTFDKIKGQAQLSFHWDDVMVPTDPAKISGNLSFNLQDGGIKDMQGFIGRLLHLITLDLFDVFDQNLDVKEFRSSCLLDKGMIDCKDGVLDVTSLKLLFDGKTNLNDKTIDQLITVRLDITKMLGAAAILSLNPIMGAISLIGNLSKDFGDKVNSWVDQKYQVYGPWDKPKIKVVQLSKIPIPRIFSKKKDKNEVMIQQYKKDLLDKIPQDQKAEVLKELEDQNKVKESK